MEGRLRVFTAFSGYDSQCMALDRLGMDYDLVGWSEIDRYAIRAHDAIYPQWSDRNYGDISKIDWNNVPDFDLFTYSFPCTDISSAGQQRGLKEGSGTRSSLLWECKKAIEAKKPKYLLMENVKALTQKKFLPYLLEWERYLGSLGYTNFTRVLNAKDYGIPQNRERVFMVSILGDGWYEFPDPFALDKRLKDVLEKDVGESYYLSEKLIDYFNTRNDISKKKGNGFRFQPIDGDSVASSVTTKAGSRADDNYIGEPLSCAMRGRSPENPSDRTSGIPTEQRIEVGNDVANCLTTVQKDSMVIEPKFIGYTRDKSGLVVKRHLMDVSNTIHTSTGCGGNTDCFVFEPSILTPKRTDYGKAVRKDYENGDLKASRHDMTSLEPREDGISNTITTVQKDNILVEPSCYYESIIYKNDKDEKKSILEEDYERNTFEILSILRKEIGKEENKRKVGRFISFLKEEILRQDVYEKSICSEISENSGIFASTSYRKKGGLLDRTEGEDLRDMRFKKKCRCASSGWELSKQLLREFNECMSFMPSQITQKTKRYVYYMWKTDKRAWILQQALYSLEKIWESPNLSWQNYRIRKLTPREIFRLMGVSESNIDKIQAAGISKTQQYKMAGNSIVVDVLYYIFRSLFVEKRRKTGQLSLF